MKKRILIISGMVIVVLTLVFYSSKALINKFQAFYLETETPSYADSSAEITGKLSEDSRDQIFVLEQEKYVAAMANNLSNKVLRWGISRRPNNQTPNADPGAPELISKYGGIYLGDTSKKVVYLTFDEGYENGYTAKILDTLKNNKVNAIFFVTGPYLKEQGDLIKRMVDEGHVVGNHTVNHPSLPEISDDELIKEVVDLDKYFYEKYKIHMSCFRAPKGEYSERTLKLTKDLGYKNIFWSLAYDDWYRDKSRGADYANNIVLRNLHNGAIILLHAVSKDNADALDGIIKEARQNGYEFGNVNNIK